MEFEATKFPFEAKLPKLIRDKIPAIIESKGDKSEVQKITSDEEFLKYLLQKIIEEAMELLNARSNENTQEELADILEIMDVILKLKGWIIEDILAVQKEKREKNGGFDERLLLLSISKGNE